MGQDIRVIERRSSAVRRRETADLPEALENLALRFAPAARREVRRLLRSSPRMADLGVVFPGALFALASRRGPAAQRLNALALIESGAQLKAVARVLDLPMWLRRLPPEAFEDVLPDLPKGEAFARRIATRLPKSAAESAFWLRAVAFGARACDEDFAIWIAEQPIFMDGGDAEKLLIVLAAYAWFSRKPDAAGHQLIVVPWRPEIAFDTALCAAKSWFNRVRLVLQLPRGALNDPWLKPAAAQGFTFEPLLSHDDILAEAQAMQNCADQYAERLIREKCRLFSVRRNGQRVATLEIGSHQREAGVLAINQLKARHNMAATADVWQAAYAWMACQPGLKRIPPLAVPERSWDQTAWQTLIRPYRIANNGAPWFDEQASHLMFAGLDAELCDLARRGGVSSWLFT
jgi:hypothetical protein